MYEGKLLHVYFDEVEISGKTYRREVVSHPGAAAVIPVTENKEILFCQTVQISGETGTARNSGREIR